MHVLDNDVVQALCWTLIHSLWQGLLLAVVGGVIISLTKKANAALRYKLLSVLFLLFIVLTGLTFATQLELSSQGSAWNETQVSVKSGQAFNASHPILLPGADGQKSNLDIFVSYFNDHASLIVTIWFIILSAQCVRLIANAGYVQRIKNHKTHPAPKYWNRRMKELADRLHIKQRIVLLQSEIVKVPVMVGIVKPVILFPFSLMLQLPPEQVEAVLLHELAHIKRKDYFVNLLQHLAEIIFFFNPGVLWISSVLRDERENCCDDIAIAESNSKKEFVHALVSFQEYTLSDSRYTLAFPGRKNHLLNRIKRILTNNNKTLSNMEKISLATGIAVVIFVSIAFTRAPKTQFPNGVSFKDTVPAIGIVNDSIPDTGHESSSFDYTTSIDGKQYRLHEINNIVADFYIDGTKVPDDKIGGYQAIIKKIHGEAEKHLKKLEDEKISLSKKMAELDLQRAKLIAEEKKMDIDKNVDQQHKLEAESKELFDRIMALKAAQNDHSIIVKDSLGRLEDSLAFAEKERAEAYDLMAAKQQLTLMADANVGKKINQELQEQLAKQNAELMALAEELRIQQEIMKKESKTLNEKDAKKQAEILNKQIIELKKEQDQIQLQRKKINEMMLNEDRNSMASPAIPATPGEAGLLKESAPVLNFSGALQLSGANALSLSGLTPLTLSLPSGPPAPPDALTLTGISAMPPVPPLENTKPLKSIINALLDEKIVASRDELSIVLNDETLIVNGVVQPAKIHDEFKEKYLSGKNDHVNYSKHGGSTHVDISVNNGSSRANLSETK